MRMDLVEDAKQRAEFSRHLEAERDRLQEDDRRRKEALGLT